MQILIEGPGNVILRLFRHAVHMVAGHAVHEIIAVKAIRLRGACLRRRRIRCAERKDLVFNPGLCAAVLFQNRRDKRRIATLGVVNARLQPAVNVVGVNQLLERAKLAVHIGLVLAAVAASRTFPLGEGCDQFLLETDFTIQPVVNRS